MGDRIIINKGNNGKYFIHDEKRSRDTFEVSLSGLLKYLDSLGTRVPDLDTNWVIDRLQASTMAVTIVA